MRNVWIVIENEIRTKLTNRSFWIMTFVFPAFILAINLGTQIFVQNEMAEVDDVLLGAETAVNLPQLGYVDQAGIIISLPPELPADHFQAYADPVAAQAALDTAEIDLYLLVPADFPQSDPVLVDSTFSPLGNRQEGLFEYLLAYNLVGDAATAQTILNPTARLRSEALNPVAAAETVSPLVALVPYFTMFIFFFLLVSGSGYMLSSVSREKENRTMEVLLVSLEPRQLMLGKVLGLGLVTLVQMAIWLGGGVLVFSSPVDISALAGSIEFPPNFLLWALLFFLAGYFLYGALMGMVGALAPNAREASQFTFVVLLPLLVPLWLNSALTHNPNGTLAVVFSLFPFTAPITIMTRLAAGPLPLWQLLVALAGLIVTAYLCVALAARSFRADTLLSAAPLSWQRLRREWRSA